MTTEQLSLSKTAKKALDSADGDWAAATDLLCRWVRADTALYQALVEPMIDSAAYAAIRNVAHAARSRFKIAGLRANPDNSTGLKAIAAENWLDYPLQGGLKLGNASKNDLKTEIKEHEVLVKSNAKQARLYKKIITKMGAATTVRDALNGDDIALLWKEADHA